jgi:hypothetical protein
VPSARPGAERLVLVAYVPESHLEALLEALFAAGAGSLGAYDRCAFVSRGEGRFRPRAGARPFLGGEGRDELVAEARIETLVPADRRAEVEAALRAAHPYEEPAFHFLPADLGSTR